MSNQSFTNIHMKWDDDGAEVFFEGNKQGLPELKCPRCGAAVKKQEHHRCGNRQPSYRPITHFKGRE